VRYVLDDQTTVVGFEIDPCPGFQPAGPGEIVGKLRKAIEPLVAGARVVLEQVKAAGPQEVEVGRLPPSGDAPGRRRAARLG
jgi:hypothetical protein